MFALAVNAVEYSSVFYCPVICCTVSLVANTVSYYALSHYSSVDLQAD